MYYVYFLKNEKQKIYYGSTGDLRKRLKLHNSGRIYSTKGDVWELVYYEAYFSELDARNREKQLKIHGQALGQVKRRIKDSLIRS